MSDNETVEVVTETAPEAPVESAEEIAVRLAAEAEAKIEADRLAEEARIAEEARLAEEARKARVAEQLPRATTLVEERVAVPWLKPTLDFLLSQLEPEAVQLAEKNYKEMIAKEDAKMREIGGLPAPSLEAPISRKRRR